MDCPHLDKTGEDKRLENWTKWITIRKKFHENMYNIQQRRPSSLVLNSAENCRRVLEDKLVFEYAKIPQVDPVRGKPSFWDLPPASKKFPSLISVQPKQKDYEIPDIEYCGVPTAIKKEKNVFEDDSDKKNDAWHQNKYRKRRLKQLAPAIKLVEPHKPETDDLIVIGNKITNPSKQTDTNLLNISPTSSKENLRISYDEKQNQEDKLIASLQIEDFLFTYGDRKQKQRHCNLFINYDIGFDKIVNRTFTIKNTGNVALKYHWRLNIERKVFTNIIPYKVPKLSFVFQKNEMIILPGETKNLIIYFMTDKRGLHQETWELITQPTVFSKGRLFLNLCAFAEEQNFNDSHAEIIDRIDKGVKYTIIEDAILSILKKTDKATIRENTHEQIKLTEKDIFEAVNAKFGSTGSLPMIYFYDKELVNNLKQIYDELKTAKDPEIWNYKIDDIQFLIKNCYNKQLQKNSEFKFRNIIESLRKTKLIENVSRHMYCQVYMLLCTAIDEISERVYSLRKKFDIRLIEKYPIVTKETLLRQMDLDDNNRSLLYFSDITERDLDGRVCVVKPFEAPPMESLRLISLKNSKELHKAYHLEKYGIIIEDEDEPKEETDKKGKKGKKDKGKGNKKEVKDKKKDKDDKKGKGNKKEKEDKNKKIAPIIRTESSIHQEQSISNLVTQYVENNEINYDCEDEQQEEYPDTYMYDYNMYTTIYHILCETVNDIELIMNQIQHEKTVSHEILKNCINLRVPTLKRNKKKVHKKINWKDVYERIFNSEPTIFQLIETKDPEPIPEDICSKMAELAFRPSTQELRVYECVDVATETEGGELYPPKFRTAYMQTDGPDYNYDLVAQTERVVSKTSVGLFTSSSFSWKSSKESSTQMYPDEFDWHSENEFFVDTNIQRCCEDCVLE